MPNKTRRVGMGKKVAIGAGVLAAGTAAYLLLGPKGKKNRKAVQDWSEKMRQEVVREIKKAKVLSEPLYQEIVARAREKYEAVKNIDKKDLARFATLLENEWKKISKAAKPAKRSK